MLPARRARRGRDRPSTVPDMGRAVARRLLSRRCAPSTARRASPVGCSKMRLSFGRKWWRDGRLFQKASESARFRPDHAETAEPRRILDQTTAEPSENCGTQTHFGPVDAMGSTIGPVPWGHRGCEPQEKPPVPAPRSTGGGTGVRAAEEASSTLPTTCRRSAPRGIGRKRNLKGPALRPSPSSIPSTQCKSSDALPFLATLCGCCPWLDDS